MKGPSNYDRSLDRQPPRERRRAPTRPGYRDPRHGDRRPPPVVPAHMGGKEGHALDVVSVRVAQGEVHRLLALLSEERLSRSCPPKRRPSARGRRAPYLTTEVLRATAANGAASAPSAEPIEVLRQRVRRPAA
jgi:hypothetical protein